jgi:erythromycin esterase
MKASAVECGARGGGLARRALAIALRADAVALCLAFSVGASASDASAEAFISCATRVAAPLREEAQLEALRGVVGGASAVALGEPAHGSPAPLELRNRIIRYLVERLGFTAIALETSFGESRAVYDFVAEGTHASLARSVARENLTWGFGAFAENEQLISWLRDYNANPAHARKVHFYGIDLSGADDHGSFPRARASVDRSLEVLASVAPEQAGRIKAQVEPALALFSDKDASRISSARHTELKHAFRAIGEGFHAQRKALIFRIGVERYEWAVQELAVAQKMQAYLRAAPKNAGTGDQIPPDGYVQDEMRDAAMAENVRWVLKHEGADGRVLVFAHDAHVMNALLRGGIWSVYSRPPRAMGHFLRAALGRSFVSIGTLAATDAPASTEAILARIGAPPFLLDLQKAACDTAAASWLSRRRSIRINYQSSLDVGLRNAFDAIVYLDRIERRK